MWGTRMAVMLVACLALADAFRLAGLVHTGRRSPSRSISRTHLLVGSSAASSRTSSAVPESARGPRPTPEGASLRPHEEMAPAAGAIVARFSASAARAAGGGFGGSEEEDRRKVWKGGVASNIVVDSAGFSWIPVPVRH